MESSCQSAVFDLNLTSYCFGLEGYVSGVVVNDRLFVEGYVEGSFVETCMGTRRYCLEGSIIKPP